MKNPVARAGSLRIDLRRGWNFVQRAYDARAHEDLAVPSGVEDMAFGGELVAGPGVLIEVDQEKRGRFLGRGGFRWPKFLNDFQDQHLGQGQIRGNALGLLLRWTA